LSLGCGFILSHIQLTTQPLEKLHSRAFVSTIDSITSLPAELSTTKGHSMSGEAWNRGDCRRKIL